MKMIQRSELARRFGLSPTGLSKMAARMPDFPKSVKMGGAQQSRVFFDDAEVSAWLEKRRTKITEVNTTNDK